MFLFILVLHMSIPTLDLSLLDTNNRDALLDTLKHALIEHSVFYVSNYTGHLDNNIIDLLMYQSSSFFDNAGDPDKSDIAMNEHFAGYTRLGDREVIQFSSNSETNQYPSAKYFAKSVDDLLVSMDSFCAFFTSLCLESLGVEDDGTIVPTKQLDKFAQLKIINSSSSSSSSSTTSTTTSTSTSTSTSQIKTIPSAFKLTFHSNTTSSLQFKDIYDQWITVPSKPNTMIVQVGQTLQHLTQGVCISSVYREPYSPGIAIPYDYNVKCELKLAPLPMGKELIQQRNVRDKSRKRDPGQGPKFNYSTESLKHRLFHENIRSYRDVAGRWYPDVLKQLDDDSSTSLQSTRESNGLHPTRLIKLFTALDNIIHLNVPTRTADIKVYTLLPQVKSLSEMNVTMDDLLQVLYIWDSFVKLKIDHDDDYVVDVDMTRSMLSISDLMKRRDVFAEKLDAWLQKNPNAVVVPALDKSVLEVTQLSVLTSSRKRSRTTNVLQKEYKRAKPVDTSKVNTNGLSLLDRVRAKEAAKLSSEIPPEVKYLRYLDSKLPQVLDIVATMRPDRPHSTKALCEQFSTSLRSLSSQESLDLVARLSTRFPNEFTLFRGKSASVLRWGDIDVNVLKSKLN